jgi:hypothetical protein
MKARKWYKVNRRVRTNQTDLLYHGKETEQKSGSQMYRLMEGKSRGADLGFNMK